MPYRKCPHCKGETGFEITVKISGYNVLKIDFGGNVIEKKKHDNGSTEKYAKCLDCGKAIITTSLDLKQT